MVINMKKIERNSVKYLIILITMVALFGIILYPLFDFVYYKFITNSEFVYSVKSHIVQPIIFACIFGTTFWVVGRKKK